MLEQSAQLVCQAAKYGVQIWFWLEELYLRTARGDRQSVLVKLSENVDEFRNVAERLRSSVDGIQPEVAVLDKLIADLYDVANAFELPSEMLVDCEFRFDWELERYNLRLAALRQPLVRALNGIKVSTDLRSLFELTYLLYAELYPTFGGGQLLDSQIELLKRLRGPFSAIVRRRLQRLTPEIRVRVQPDWAVFQTTREGAYRQIQLLIDVIESVTLPPQELPDDLYLEIDQEGGCIRRLGKCAQFPHPRRWDLLKALKQAGKNFITTEKCCDILNTLKSPTTVVDQAAAVTAIADIRKCLHKIELDIENQRMQGYRICHFPAPRGRKREQSRSQRSTPGSRHEKQARPADGDQ